MSTDLCASKSSTALDEKAARIYQNAEAAMANREFVNAVNILEEIPAGLRSDEAKILYDKACRARHAQQRFDAAKRQFEARQFDFAVRSIAQIPEEDRDDECRQLEQNARVQLRLEPMLDNVRARMKARDYEEAVRLLEGVPQEIRTPEIVELLGEAQSCLRRFGEIWEEIESRHQQAEEERIWKHYADILPLLDEAEVIQPHDPKAAALRAEILPFRERFRKRDMLMDSARRCFKNRDYESADERLLQIPEDDRCGEFTDLSIQNEKRRIVACQLADEIVEALRNNAFDTQMELWKQLAEVRYYPVELAIAELTDEEFRQCLVSLIEGHDGSPLKTELLDRYVGAVSSEWIFQFLTSRDASFIEKYPSGSLIICEKLADVLQRLPGDLPRVRERVERLKSLIDLLGDHRERLAEWERFLNAADRFCELHDGEWTRMEQWYESTRSIDLDNAAREFAEASAVVLPDQSELRDVLNVVVGDTVNRGDTPFQRAYAKFRIFDRKGEWSAAPLVPITPRRIVIFAGSIAGLSVLGLAANLALSLLFNIGGAIGFGMVFFLAALWSFFCFAANKVL